MYTTVEPHVVLLKLTLEVNYAGINKIMIKKKKKLKKLKKEKKYKDYTPEVITVCVGKTRWEDDGGEQGPKRLQIYREGTTGIKLGLKQTTFTLSAHLDSKNAGET